MKKLICVFFVPLTERIRHDWCIGYLLEHGVPLEYWDITKLYPTGVGSTNPVAPPVALIEDFAELEARAALPENAEAVFLLSMNYEARYQRLFRLLTRLGRTIAIIDWGYQPLTPPSKARRFVSDPLLTARRACGKLLSVASTRLGFVKPFDVVFAAGRAAQAAYPRAKRIVPVNLCDYDNFREIERKPERLVAGRYAVFLDNNQAHNPDLALHDIPFLDAPRYFASLNRYFRLVEERFGLRVAVAAHPKSDYAADLFEGRPLIKGRTPELIRDAELVLCHLSTTIGTAVMARKPLIFIYTGQMLEIYRNTHVTPMEGYASYLGAPMVNVDAVRAAAEIELKPVDSARYDAYKYDFLTNPETENQFTRDILLRELSRPGRS